ncbi:putative nad dependent epimerase dehydratase protein [Phaeoacremonium minimum UCRPA7]|uniref:Putative nad dependent epimerase dehydratase protein n=1 Tax=Phaeoacremonium minimum (strain UCR-PA7) TaxID=1286976 RepID=R8BYF5_PHAM7|nr:putative nad dependent epimerase dehydratase protein [Phaeoacremonium minimum UCRPA7]EOO04372.1 putative nad dependent epimerase dehydratase protein [Phaeoacremonium minimum UCRPA7]
MSRHVLVLGGHGKVAQLLTPLLLQRSWTVTSIIRSEEQVPTVRKLGDNQSGQLNVLVRSIEDVKEVSQAKSILDEVKPDYIVWSAGAGGKGGPERTLAIDRDAAIAFIRAAASTPSITKFLNVSHLASRRQKPSWWGDAAWQTALNTNKKLATYYQAKIAADEVLYEEGRKRKDFAAINLRPGTLTSEPAGRVELGRTANSAGEVSRANVAAVAALLLEADGTKNSWLDLLDGKEEPEAAVKRVVSDGVDAAEGEPVYQSTA